MRFIELFAGIGGFRYGLEKANQSSQSSTEKSGSTELEIQQGGKWTSIKGERNNLPDRYGELSSYRCVWGNELNKYACQIYRKHYGEICEQDIRAVDPSTIPEHDLITAGFPCQSFSIAGKRGGFEDTRGTLFFEICRIARAKRTPYLLLENVKGLLSHDNGDTFQTILRTLDELGYDCQWQVLNSKNFGVPQNRERVFIIGHLRGQPRPKVFPIGETDQVYPESDGGIAHAIDSNYHKGWLDNQQRTMIYHENISGIRTPHEEAQALRSGASHNYQTVDEIRRLTPIECERLQGFPDNWTAVGMPNKNDTHTLKKLLKTGGNTELFVTISDTQRYKCLGNAVTTNVIEAIGRQWRI